MFYPDRCNDCGECFVRCQYVDYSPQRAVREMLDLKAGRDAEILHTCITCMACNEYCPTNAHPYDLIMKLQEEKRLLLVPEGTPDFIEQTLSSVPNRTIEGEGGKPVLCLCVMQHAYPPDMTRSMMFDGMKQVSGGDYFSRIVYLHTAMESKVREHAGSFIRNCSRLNADEIVFVHDDCYALAAVKAPEYGITVPFRPVHIVEHMVRFMKSNPQQVTKLNRKVAYQRPCISRYTPEKEPFVDEFFQLAGVERVARQHDRENALCCAFGLRQTDPERGHAIMERNLLDAKTHGAEAMVFLCPGCYWLTSQACEEYGLAAVFITDLAKMALGELAFASRPWTGDNEGPS